MSWKRLLLALLLIVLLVIMLSLNHIIESACCVFPWFALLDPDSLHSIAEGSISLCFGIILGVESRNDEADDDKNDKDKKKK